MHDILDGPGQRAPDVAAHAGQAMLEYAAVLLLVTLVVMVAASALGEAVARLLTRAIIRL